MSLKAKIEAVIYASEEPVTLAQLIGLLGEEGQAELDAIAAQQHSLSLVGAMADEPPDDQPPTELEAEAANEPDSPEPASSAISAIAEPDNRPGEPGPQDLEGSASLPSAEPDAEAAATGPASPGETAQDAALASAVPATPEIAPPNGQPSEANQKLAARRLRDYFRSLLDQLIADYANGDRGLEIREVASGFRLATKPEFHDAVRGFVKSLKPPLKLSLQALETLAVVAYKQPVTAPEVSEIRGVDSAGVLGSLLSRKLVTTAGRKQVIGRPILYKTTKEFLLRFGLKDINELPSIEEFERMAGELNDAVQEEIPMEDSSTPPEADTEPLGAATEEAAALAPSDGAESRTTETDGAATGTDGAATEPESGALETEGDAETESGAVETEENDVPPHTEEPAGHRLQPEPSSQPDFEPETAAADGSGPSRTE